MISCTFNPRRARWLRFGYEEPLALRVVVENFRVASPVDCSFQLPGGLFRAEALIQDVAEELRRQCAVGFGVQGVADLPQEGHMLEGRLAEKHFALQDV